jgi:hypothetical protein
MTESWKREQELASRYRALLAELKDTYPGKVTDVEHLYGQAMAYVWGRQDALGQGAKDTGWSMEFAAVYGAHAAEYELGRTGMRDNIQAVYDRWRAES